MFLVSELSPGRYLVSAVVLLLSSTSLATYTLAADPVSSATIAAHKKPSVIADRADKVTVRGRLHMAPGGGLMQIQTAPVSRSTVTSEFISKQSPTMNAYQALELVPGANVASGDPYGIGNNQSITLRGLAGNQIGQLWEGMPVNDIEAYGGYPSYWADSEDIGLVSLVPGSTDIDTPVITSAGGFTSTDFRDPSPTRDNAIDYTYGNYRTQRVYVRLESGLIGQSGIRSFISYSHMSTDNSDGPGRNYRQHVDFEALKEWGSGNRVSLAGSLSDMTIIDDVKPTLGDWNLFGRSNTRDGAYTFGDTNYWRLNRAPWRQFMMSGPLHLVAIDRLSFDVTPYFLYADGNSPGGSTLDLTGNTFGTESIPGSLSIPNSQNGVATVLADYVSVQALGGVNASADYKLDRHNDIKFGWWYQYSSDDESIPYSPITANGSPPSIWSVDNIRLPDGRVYYSQADHTKTQINALYAADTISLLNDALHVSAGFRAQMVNRDGTNGLPGAQYKLGGNYFEPLPRLTMTYQLSPTSQIFANVMTSSVMPTDDSLYDSYSGGLLASVGNPNLKPEYAISEELGYRYYGKLFNASATFFNYNFTNRQLSTIIYRDGVEINSSINAGGQTTRGVDAELSLHSFHHFTPYVSFEYLHATTDNNLQAGTDYLPTAGKTAPSSPKIMSAIGITYDDGHVFGSFSFKYTGSQYSTFMDDEKMPAYTSANLALGYRLPSIGFAKHPEIRVNLVNIDDAKYLSGVASTQMNARTTTGIFGTSVAGSSPTYWTGPSLGAMITLSSNF
ncbi:MAG: TonB-dependent receptor [Janthinobacterium lividum]